MPVSASKARLTAWNAVAMSDTSGRQLQQSEVERAARPDATN